MKDIACERVRVAAGKMFRHLLVPRQPRLRQVLAIPSGDRAPREGIQVHRYLFLRGVVVRFGGRADFHRVVVDRAEDFGKATGPAGRSRQPAIRTWPGQFAGTVHDDLYAVVAAGIANPFAPFEWPMGGDEAGRALEAAICHVAGEANEGNELTTDNILGRLTEDGTLDVVVPSAKNELGQKQRLGHKLAHLRGRTFTDTRERRFEFGHKDAAPGARYTLHFLPHESGN